MTLTKTMKVKKRAANASGKKRNVARSGRNRARSLNPSWSKFRGGYGASKFIEHRVEAPRAIGKFLENTQSTTHTLFRSAIIGNVDKKAGGFFAQGISMHPSVIPWVRDLCALYDKYHFNSISVRLLTNVGTTHVGVMWLGFNYEDHHAIASSFIEAQAYDKFNFCPVWGSSEWVSIPPVILKDKWYDCTKEAKGDSFHDWCPARCVFGYDGSNATSGTLLARVEIKFSVTFSRPTIGLDTKAEYVDPYGQSTADDTIIDGAVVID